VANGINAATSDTNACLIITHYQRILDHVVPTHVHVMIEGLLVRTGGPELAMRVEEDGYEWLEVAAV